MRPVFNIPCGPALGSGLLGGVAVAAYTRKRALTGAFVLLLGCSEQGAPTDHTSARPALRHQLPPAVKAAPSVAAAVPAASTEPAHLGEEQSPPAPQSGSDALNVPQRGKVRLIVIGDYGWAGPQEQQVAELVDLLQPDYVLTTGDNNYPFGDASTIDQNIGQYFSELIFPYRGAFASSATENRFFPVLGNHDWETPGAAPYLDYFTLPGNERYYEVALGPVRFFAVDSDPREPDGIDAESTQGKWLATSLAASTSPFNIVAMHHPPYSSGPHGSTLATQWPYRAWGADLVLAGHDHGYERLEVDGLPYVVSGLGGVSIYSFGEPVPGSLVRYNEQFGVTVLDADERQLRLAFFNIEGQLIDTSTLYVTNRTGR